MKKILILFLCLILLISCGKKKDNKQEFSGKTDTTTVQNQNFDNLKITTDDFINYYVEAAKIQEKYSNQPDSIAIQLKKLQQDLGISEPDIKQFADVHRNSPQRWELIWKQIEDRIKSESK